MTSTELPLQVGHFAMRFSSTPRGVRLARRMCGERLAAWDVPYGSDAHDAVILITAELCANAVRHGHVPGRDFHVRLAIETPATASTAVTATVRVEVTDTRAERLPVLTPGPTDSPDDHRTSGRGLLLVEALADRWGWTPRTDDGPGKTVWAEYALPLPLAVPQTVPSPPLP
ncbi:ATP-binding protein [Streptomyces phyllanthi]|nr:ATP-binding protein [Streptomyces phyllanthi]